MRLYETYLQTKSLRTEYKKIDFVTQTSKNWK